MENGTTILFGLPGVAVDRVERDEQGVRNGPPADRRRGGGGLPGMRGAVEIGPAAADDPAA